MPEIVRVGAGVTGWVVEFEPRSDHWVDFRAWRVTGLEGTSDTPLFGTNNEFTPDRASVSPDAKGYLKWDGCSEWEWPTGNCHLCGRSSVRERVDLLNAVYDWGLKHFGEECR